MRKLLLFGTTSLILIFGATSAHATPYDPVANFALNQQALMADANPPLIEGRSAFTGDADERAPAVERAFVGRTFRQEIEIMRNVALLAAAGLVFGLGAIGAKALWISDPTESAPFGDRPL